MNDIAQLFVILSIVLFNGYLIHILRKELIEYQYALLWLTAGLGMLFFAIYPKALWDLSDFLGIGIPLNLVYFSAIILCLVLIFQTNISLSKIRQSNNDLIQEVSMLKSQVDQLQKQLTETQP